MPLFPDFLIHTAVIEGQGVPKEDAQRLGLIPAMLNMPMMQGIVVSTLIGRNNVPPPATNVISAGPPPPPPNPQVFVPVPDVVGKSFEEASAILEKSGLHANRLSIQQAGEVVLVQKPPAGEPAPIDSSVDLFIGQPEPAPVKLIKLEGLIHQPEERVRKQLEGEDLLVVEVLVDVINESYKPCVVVDHQPGPGALVGQGTTVTLYVQVEKAYVTGKPVIKAATTRSAKSSQPAESDPKPS